MDDYKLIRVRKLAAIDLALHGALLILTEFGAGVFLLTAFGFYLYLSGTASLYGGFFGVYLMSLGLNYVPLFAYALAINRRKSAKTEVAAELADMRHFGWKYGYQQVLILVPLAIPILALFQEWRGVR